MKIRKLQLKNIGVFDDETIEFQPCPVKDKAEIHIFTGQNGSGKTTILQTLTTLFSFSFYGKGENEVFVVPTLWRNHLVKKLQEIVDGEIVFEVKHNEEWRKCIFAFNTFENLGHISSPNSFYKDSRIDNSLIYYSEVTELENFSPNKRGIVSEPLEFAVFAYSGYRRVKNEKINLFDEVEENPLRQALDFIKDENSKFTINQWLGRNLSKRALALENKEENSQKFTENIKNLEKVVADIVGYNIHFKLKTDLTLVLIKDNQELDFDVLPDGLKSLISWIGDLLMRLDSLKWKNDTPIFEREIILFLDEIEVHLHPAWQRKVLPVVQKLFKNSQIFVSTHSPFVVNSIDDAWVYKLELENGKAKIAKGVKSEDGISYQTVLSEIFGIDKEFGGKTQDDLDKFYSIVRNGKKIEEKELKKLAKSLAEQSEELNSIVQIELRQLSRRKGKKFSI